MTLFFRRNRKNNFKHIYITCLLSECGSLILLKNRNKKITKKILRFNGIKLKLRKYSCISYIAIANLFISESSFNKYFSNNSIILSRDQTCLLIKNGNLNITGGDLRFGPTFRAFTKLKRNSTTSSSILGLKGANAFSNSGLARSRTIKSPQYKCTLEGRDLTGNNTPGKKSQIEKNSDSNDSETNSFIDQTCPNPDDTLDQNDTPSIKVHSLREYDEDELLSIFSEYGLNEKKGRKYFEQFHQNGIDFVEGLSLSKDNAHNGKVTNNSVQESITLHKAMRRERTVQLESTKPGQPNELRDAQVKGYPKSGKNEPNTYEEKKCWDNRRYSNHGEDLGQQGKRIGKEYAIARENLFRKTNGKDKLGVIVNLENALHTLEGTKYYKGNFTNSALYKLSLDCGNLELNRDIIFINDITNQTENLIRFREDEYIKDMLLNINNSESDL